MDRHTAEATLAEFGYDPRQLDRNARHGFLQSAKNGPLRLLEAFIVCGIPMRAASDREPPIIKAAESGQLAHVELVLAHGGSLDTLDIAGDTALHTAVNWGHEKLVAQLCALGAKPNTFNNAKWTPLSQAVHKEKRELVEALLEAGADPKFGATPATSPLAFAKDAAMAERLLTAGADPNILMSSDTGNHLLMSRALGGKVEIVQVLLAHGAEDRPNATGWTAAMVAHDKRSGRGGALAALFPEPNLPESPQADTRLHQAASSGAIEEVQRLLDEGAPIDGLNAYGTTPLFSACSKQHWQVAELLLERGADATVANAFANSALTFAAQAGAIRWVRRLLEAGAPANEATPHGEDAPRSLALVLAASSGHLEVVQALLEAGASFDSRDKFEQTAVFLAASKGHPEVLRCLLDAGADANVGGRETTSPLHIAVGAQRVECVAILCERGADLEKLEMFGKTALHRIADSYNNTKPEHGEIARILLEAGANFLAVDEFDRTPLDCAITTKNKPVIDAMLAVLIDEWVASHTRRQKVDWATLVPDVTPVHLKGWMHRDDVEAIAALLDAGLDPGLFVTGAQPLLHAALGRKSTELATLLLGHNVNARCESKSGATALMVAAGQGHLELVERLLRLGLDPNAMSVDYASTPLTRAAACGNLEVAQLLLQAGAEVNPLRGGWSPLMRAAQKKDLAMVRLFLDHGADPNVVASSGKQTALDVAQKAKADDIVALLSEVTEVDLRDAAGNTALLRACVKGDLPAVAQLLEAGADPEATNEAGDSPRTVGVRRKGVASLLGLSERPWAADEIDSGEPFVGIWRSDDRSAFLADGHQPDPDARSTRGDSALHIAVLLHDRALAESLLERGANPNAKNTVGDTPWSLGLRAGGFDDLLSKHGAKIDVNQQVVTSSHHEAFRVAMAAGDLRGVAQQLVDQTVHPHLLGRWSTPLLLAVRAHDAEMVTMLLAMGCDPLARVADRSLLAQAAGKGNTSVVRALLDGGVPIDEMVLPTAARHGRGEVLAALLEAGAHPAMDLDGLGAEALRVWIDVLMERELFEAAQSATTQLRLVVARG